MNIIICDDRIDDRKNLSDLLSGYGEKKNYEFTITEYESGEQLCEEQSALEACQLLFLDINMQGMDGLKTDVYKRQVYLIGKDARQDKERAYDYFLKSAEQGNIYAAYFLEHWNDMPHPDLLLMATRLMRHLEHIMGENVFGRKSGGSRQGIDRKLARKIRQKKIAQGHAVDDHENMVQTQ